MWLAFGQQALLDADRVASGSERAALKTTAVHGSTVSVHSQGANASSAAVWSSLSDRIASCRISARD
jgi:hypothetical protein